MANDDLRLVGVITLPTGTLLQYENDGPTTVYFYDANHNQKLDKGDKKVLEVTVDEDQIQARGQRISDEEIRRFGTEASFYFARAGRERMALQGKVPAQRIGRCFFPLNPQGEDAFTVEGLRFNFQPPLSLQSTQAPREKLYQSLDLLTWNRRSPLDPSRCLKAEAQFPQKTVAGQRLSPAEIQLHMPHPFFLPALAVLGLENNGAVDALYRLAGGIEMLHVDLIRNDDKARR